MDCGEKGGGWAITEWQRAHGVQIRQETLLGREEGKGRNCRCLLRSSLVPEQHARPLHLHASAYAGAFMGGLLRVEAISPGAR